MRLTQAQAAVQILQVVKATLEKLTKRSQTMGAQVWRTGIQHAPAKVYSLLTLPAVHRLRLLQTGTLLGWVQIFH